MQDSNDTEASYSPSLWVVQDSVGQSYNSPFDGQEICPPFMGTPLNTQDRWDNYEPVN